MKKILLAGGYGNAGYQVAHYLLNENPAISLTIAGRDYQKALNACERLSDIKTSARLKALQLDLSDGEALRRILVDYDLLLVASSTIQYTDIVIQACLESNTDYYDIQISSTFKQNALNQYRDQIKNNGRCFITDGGFHPGILSTLIRHAGIKFDMLTDAHVYVGLRVDWHNLLIGRGTRQEFVEEMKDYSTRVMLGGKWKKASFWKTYSFDFGKDIGKCACVPMYFDELEPLKEYIPELENAAVYITGFNVVTDFIVLPVVWAGMKVLPVSCYDILSRFFWWSLKYCKPPYLVKIVLKAKGILKDKKSEYTMTLREEDSYKMTAIPVVATLLQYLDEDIIKPGVHFQANLVQTDRFFRDMERMGIITEVNQE